MCFYFFFTQCNFFMSAKKEGKKYKKIWLNKVLKFDIDDKVKFH